MTISQKVAYTIPLLDTTLVLAVVSIMLALTEWCWCKIGQERQVSHNLQHMYIDLDCTLRSVSKFEVKTYCRGKRLRSKVCTRCTIIFDRYYTLYTKWQIKDKLR